VDTHLQQIAVWARTAANCHGASGTIIIHAQPLIAEHSKARSMQQPAAHLPDIKVGPQVCAVSVLGVCCFQPVLALQDERCAVVTDALQNSMSQYVLW
jgi:hypothetical protein